VVFSLVGDTTGVSGCAYQPPNLLAFASVLVHELVELLSDPLINAYQANAENADLCA